MSADRPSADPPTDAPAPERDPLTEEADRAHERALRELEGDARLADRMEELQGDKPGDPFFYDVWRKRTAKGMGTGTPDVPAERPRGGTARLPTLDAPAAVEAPLLDVAHDPAAVPAPPAVAPVSQPESRSRRGAALGARNVAIAVAAVALIVLAVFVGTTPSGPSLSINPGSAVTPVEPPPTATPRARPTGSAPAVAGPSVPVPTVRDPIPSTEPAPRVSSSAGPRRSPGPSSSEPRTLGGSAPVF